MRTWFSEEQKELAWDRPIRGWTYVFGMLGVGVWLFSKGAWWQIALSLPLFFAGTLSLLLMGSVTLAKGRRKHK